jgi:CSLREA domain-containing protein
MNHSHNYPLRLTRILLLVACSLSWIVGSPSQESQAKADTSAYIIVNTTEDELNSDGDCSLREAVKAANTDAPVDSCPPGSSADTIILSVGIYTLTKEGINEDAAESGDLDITNNLSIVGVSTRDTIIDGNHSDRIFEIIGPTTFFARKLTLQNGHIPSGGMYGGGAILNNLEGVLNLNLVELRDNSTAKSGGAIDNIGSARLNYVTLDGNLSSPAGFGGAIYNPGSLVVENSLFSNNSAYNESTIDYGGGLFNNKIVTLLNVTFSHNSAEWGGGLFNQGTETNLYNVTFTENTSAIHTQFSLRIINSIVAGSTDGENCAGDGTIDSLGHNLDSGNSCDFELENIDPLLGSLTNNLGPTFTHALLASSPAIDSGDPIDCPDTDQRGALRPADGDMNGSSICDIGAYEYLALFPILIHLPILGK